MYQWNFESLWKYHTLLVSGLGGAIALTLADLLAA